MPAELRIGTAGWSIPRDLADRFGAEGGALERYATIFTCAEINSSFHRSHRPSTYERWAASVPDDFRFSAKLPKTITHKQKLADCADLVAAFVEEMRPLGDKLAIILVQLPPSLQFDEALAGYFFDLVRSHSRLPLACEPRHPSWFTPAAEALLVRHGIARVAADPAKAENGGTPGGANGLAYWRLHGSPVPYRSSYDPARLESYASAIAAEFRSGADAWCIFDNTASSAATGNALDLQAML